MGRYSVERISDVLVEVRIPYVSGTKQSFLLCSDIHFDNPNCDRKLFFSDLDRARQKGAGVLVFGDFYDLMQGKYDPRRSKKNVRPEYNKENYLDLVLSDAANQLAPYADLFVLLADGNHETGILKNLEVNPLDHLAERLNYKHGGKVFRGGYQGFVRFVMEHEKGGQIRSSLLYYHHGRFGGVVTKGVLGVNRHGLSVPDADIIVVGHTHDRWLVEQVRYRMKQNGRLKVESQYHVKTGCYKQEFERGSGWAIEKIVMPKNLGGWWVTFSVFGRNLVTSFEMT